MHEVKIEEGSSVTVRDLLQKEDTSAILQADVYDMVARCFDVNSSTPSTATHEWHLDIPSVLFDTLQDDSAWDDDEGYNFKWTVDGSWFPKGGAHYKVEIAVEVDSQADLTPTTTLYVRFDVKTKGVASA